MIHDMFIVAVTFWVILHNEPLHTLLMLAYGAGLGNKAISYSAAEFLQVFKVTILERERSHPIGNSGLRSSVEINFGVINKVATALPGRKTAASDQIFHLKSNTRD